MLPFLGQSVRTTKDVQFVFPQESCFMSSQCELLPTLLVAPIGPRPSALLKPERGKQSFSAKEGNLDPPFGQIDLLIKARFVIRKSMKTAIIDAQMVKLYLSWELCSEIGASG